MAWHRCFAKYFSRLRGSFAYFLPSLAAATLCAACFPALDSVPCMPGHFLLVPPVLHAFYGMVAIHAMPSLLQA